MIDDTQALIDLERRRSEAIGTGNLEALADVLADDYLHVLAPGTTHTKASYVELIRKSPRRPDRGDLKVRLFGDAAVIEGDLTNNIAAIGATRQRVIPAFCTQVAVKRDGRWQFVSYILTQKKHLMSAGGA
jgi:undecaprenyl pyrophosphate synthase